MGRVLVRRSVNVGFWGGRFVSSHGHFMFPRLYWDAVFFHDFKCGLGLGKKPRHHYQSGDQQAGSVHYHRPRNDGGHQPAPSLAIAVAIIQVVLVERGGHERRVGAVRAQSSELSEALAKVTPEMPA